MLVSHWQNVPVTTGYANILYQNTEIASKGVFDSSVREKNLDDANVLMAEPHLISQVNVSALDLDPKRDSAKLFKEQCPDCMEKFAKAALRAAYAGTLYCAIKEGKKDVFLTLPGCGSFKNDLSWVADIFEEFEHTILKSANLNITLVAVEVNGNLHTGKDAAAWDRIQKVAHRTGGAIVSKR